mmetsp:Transcript_82017/g.183206  ORF Transcript_82017/g.183206 Transcript_82017/m.183206 type:complete len:238 (+) Transcript_82017:409-1122(+)
MRLAQLQQKPASCCNGFKAFELLFSDMLTKAFCYLQLGLFAAATSLQCHEGICINLLVVRGVAQESLHGKYAAHLDPEPERTSQGLVAVDQWLEDVLYLLPRLGARNALELLYHVRSDLDAVQAQRLHSWYTAVLDGRHQGRVALVQVHVSFGLHERSDGLQHALLRCMRVRHQQLQGGETKAAHALLVLLLRVGIGTLFKGLFENAQADVALVVVGLAQLMQEPPGGCSGAQPSVL